MPRYINEVRIEPLTKEERHTAMTTLGLVNYGIILYYNMEVVNILPTPVASYLAHSTTR